MKKIIAIIICLQVFLLPTYSQIEDSFVNSSLDKNLQTKVVKQVYIKDSLVDTTLDKNLKIKEQKISYIEDSFAEQNKNKNVVHKQNFVIEENLPTVNNVALVVKKKSGISDFSKSQDIKICIKNYLTTKNCDEEGSYIEFITKDDNTINNVFFPKGSIVKARIENISLNKKMGVPSELIISNFSIGKTPLIGQIEKTGANRSLWLYPTVYVGACFFGAGLLLVPIRGGHAKLRPEEVYTVQYIP